MSPGLSCSRCSCSTAACGGDSDDSTSSDETTRGREGTISDVTVTGDVGEKPEVEFKAPMTFAKTESEIVDEGRRHRSEGVQATRS